MNRLAAWLCPFPLLLALAPGALRADGPAAPGDLDRARALVEQLASEDFGLREQATQRLADMGKAAEPALKEGLGSDDLEVRRRCLVLFRRVNRTEIEAALDEFLVSHDDKVLLRLPAYQKFLKIAGKDPSSQALYIDMCCSEGELLSQLERNPGAVGTMITERCQRYQQALRFGGIGGGVGVQSVPLGQLAAMLYAIGDERVTVDTPNLYLLWNMLYQQDARKTFESNPAARKLLVAFVERRTDNAFIYQSLMLTQVHNLKECLPWVLKLATDKGQQPHVRAQALTAIARLGSRDNLADLEPLLAETTNLGQMRFNTTTINTELRDVALGVMVQLSGQDLTDYEFPFIKMNPQIVKQQTNPGFMLPYNWLGFSDNPQREAAQKKWREWAEAHKK